MDSKVFCRFELSVNNKFVDRPMRICLPYSQGKKGKALRAGEKVKGACGSGIREQMVKREKKKFVIIRVICGERDGG